MNRKSLISGVMLLCLVMACSESVSSGESVKWYSYDEGIRAGEKEGKKIFLSFYADWCTFCKKMEKETFKEPAVVKFLNRHFISVRVNTEKETEIARKHFVRGLPMTWFLEPDGEKISSLPGYIPPEMLIRILKFIQSDSYKEMTFQEYVADLEESE
jgi:thioredoxin-related protein